MEMEMNGTIAGYSKNGSIMNIKKRGRYLRQVMMRAVIERRTVNGRWWAIAENITTIGPT